MLRAERCQQEKEAGERNGEQPPAAGAACREAVMAKKYVVHLTEEERAALQGLGRKGTIAARKLLRAQILLQAESGATDEEIAAVLQVGASTVQRTRRRCVEEGVDLALTERPRPGARRLLSGKQEAHLVALACSDPPQGHVCWTMQLLANHLIALEMVPFISDETVRRVLKNRRSSPGSRRCGASAASMPSTSGTWRMSSISMKNPTTRSGPSSALTSSPTS